MALDRAGVPVFEAVLIDLDGTLMDTVADLAAAANQMRVALGQAPLPVARLTTFVGKGADVLVHRALSDDLNGQVDPPLFARGRAAFFEHYRLANGVHATVFEGVPEALARLRAHGLRLACVTNKPSEFTHPLLERVGLHGYFQSIVSADEVAQPKPYPDLLLEACQRLAVNTQQAYMVGDSINDAQAAAAAHCPCVLVETGYNEGQPAGHLAGTTGVCGVYPSFVQAADALLSGQLEGMAP